MALRYLTRTKCRNNVSPLLMCRPPFKSRNDDFGLMMQPPGHAMYTTRTDNVDDAKKKHKTTLEYYKIEAQVKPEVEKQLRALKAEFADMKFELKKQKEKAINAEMHTKFNKLVIQDLKDNYDIIEAQLKSHEKQLHQLRADEKKQIETEVEKIVTKEIDESYLYKADVVVTLIGCSCVVVTILAAAAIFRIY